MLLVGDIGATHTRLACFKKDRKLVERKFFSRDYSSLEQIVLKFLQEEAKEVQRACFGVAGPVRDGRCKITNLSWILDAAELSQRLRIPVSLLNDLEAACYGIKALREEDLFSLQRTGSFQPGNQVLVFSGTGLGEAGLIWDGSCHHPFASEGGHCDFAPRNEEEFALFLRLQKQFGHVSCERVVSGSGLLAIFRFLVESNRAVCSAQIEEEMRQRDPSAVIIDRGANGEDAACSLALDWFVSLYGAESGNAALKFLSFGGVYIGGGIAPRIIEKLKAGSFLASFLDKGRFQGILKSIPVRVILNEGVALLGAAAYANGMV